MSINAQEVILTLKLLIMLKKILNLDGAKELNQKEKKSIQGGKWSCGPRASDGTCAPCPEGYMCNTGSTCHGGSYCIVEIQPL